MQIFLNFVVLFFIFACVTYVGSRQCWGYSNYEFEGTIKNSDKIQMTCPGNYCMTLTEQGTDFNVYNGTCPDKSVSITDCETNGVGCQNEKIGSTYIKVCCCDYDMCNTSTPISHFLFFVFMIMLHLLN